MTHWGKGGCGWQGPDTRRGEAWSPRRVRVADVLSKGTLHLRDEGTVEGPSLLALAALTTFGCGLAIGQSDFLFATIFAAVGALTIIEALRRLG